MRTTLLIFALFYCFVANAQTSVIGVKSHHGEMAKISKSTDNFGRIAPRRYYDTLIRISGDCVIQIGEIENFYDRKNQTGFRDTVCSHWYYEKVQFDKEAIREYHGNDLVLIGFDDANNNFRKEDSPFFKKRTSKQSSKWLFVLIVLASLGFYVFKSESMLNVKK